MGQYSCKISASESGYDSLGWNSRPNSNFLNSDENFEDSPSPDFEPDEDEISGTESSGHTVIEYSSLPSKSSIISLPNEFLQRANNTKTPCKRNQSEPCPNGEIGQAFSGNDKDFQKFLCCKIDNLLLAQHSYA